MKRAAREGEPKENIIQLSVWIRATGGRVGSGCWRDLRKMAGNIYRETKEKSFILNVFPAVVWCGVWLKRIYFRRSCARRKFPTNTLWKLWIMKYERTKSIFFIHGLDFIILCEIKKKSSFEKTATFPFRRFFADPVPVCVFFPVINL